MSTYKVYLSAMKGTVKMKVNKSQALLFIFSVLQERKSISKTYVQEHLDIPDLTFRRYIQEIKAFFYNFNINMTIKYSRSEDMYYLVENI